MKPITLWVHDDAPFYMMGEADAQDVRLILEQSNANAEVLRVMFTLDSFWFVSGLGDRLPGVILMFGRDVNIRRHKGPLYSEANRKYLDKSVFGPPA